MRRLLGGINDEFADAAALDFHHRKGVGADTRFDARRSIGLTRHGKSFYQNVRYYPAQGKIKKVLPASHPELLPQYPLV
jgi:hypothetical protein